MRHPFRHTLLGLSSSILLLSFGFASEPTLVAEEITLKFGPFARSVAVADLREYATTGEASPKLKSLLGFIKSEQRDTITNLLKAKFPIGAVQVDQILRTSLGNQVLSQVATITQLPGGAETEALRSGLVLSAASEEGFGTLSFLEAYPVPHVTVDLQKAQKLQKSAGRFLPLIQRFLAR